MGRRWSPLVEVDGDPSTSLGTGGLRLDVTGVAHLFGGEEGLAHDVRARFAALGLSTRMAIAPTAAAAWALAHYAPCICGARSKQKLSPLHVSALRLDPDTVRTLERLGLKTIGALVDMPRLALARRFKGEEDVVLALDRLLGPQGRAADRRAHRPAATRNAAAGGAGNASRSAPQALERLVPDLVRQLQERHLGARRLSLTGYRVDGSTMIASVATAIASREPKHLVRLLADKTAALDPGFGFDAFALTAEWTEELNPAQESLIGEPSGTRDLARLGRSADGQARRAGRAPSSG